MKKVGKILMLLSSICMLGAGGWSLLLAWNRMMKASGSSAAKAYIGLAIAFFIVVFMLQVFFSGLRALKDNKKQLKKAINASICVFVIEILNMIIASSSSANTRMSRILVLVFACIFAVFGFIVKFADKTPKEAPVENAPAVEGTTATEEPTEEVPQEETKTEE